MALAITPKTIAVRGRFHAGLPAIVRGRVRLSAWRPVRPPAVAHVLRAGEMEGERGAAVYSYSRTPCDCAIGGHQGSNVPSLDRAAAARLSDRSRRRRAIEGK